MDVPTPAPVVESISITSSSTGRPTLVLSGDITVARAEDLRRALVEAMETGQDVGIDWQQVGRADASVLQVIIAAGRALAKRGLKLHLGEPSEALRELLELSGLRAVLVEG